MTNEENINTGPKTITQPTIEAIPANPLAQYMRKAVIYVSLPSNGNFTKPEDIELSASGEVGVAAMTTADELLLKTPDALLNGDAIVKIVQSCVPAIKNVHDLPTPDIDALLIAIRAASYGDDMDFTANCPKCDTPKTFAISLSESLARIEHLEPEYIVELSNNMKVSVKPHTYKSNIKQGLMTYNESQLMNVIINEDLDTPENAQQYQESINKMAELLVELTADSILAIWDPEGNFIDANKEQILEWVKNIPRKDAELIQAKIAEINLIGVYRKVALKCDNEECGHEWEADVTFDASNFFE